MTFGFSTTIDVLSWTVVLLLGVKVAATFTLLRRDKASWFRSRWSASLWWATKVTPFFAVPCMIAIALLQRRIGDAWTYGALMVFVVVAVPMIVWHRFGSDCQATRKWGGKRSGSGSRSQSSPPNRCPSRGGGNPDG